MPIYRDEDGNIIDEPTRRGGDDQGSSYDQPTRRVSSGSASTGSSQSPAQYNAETRKVGGNPPADQESADAKTQIYRPGKKPPQATADETSSAHAGVEEDAMADPPVGWLVIIQGPGKGNVLRIGIGANAIGREQDDRVTLDFGDPHISRNSHATITYDPRGRKFYVQHGGGKNLTYLNDAPVLAPTEMASHSLILIGDTLMKFVSLCGPEFDWADLD